MTTRALAGTRAKIIFELFCRRQRPPNEAKAKGNNDLCQTRPCEAGAGTSQNETLHRRNFLDDAQNQTGAEDVGNSTSSAPACSEII